MYTDPHGISQISCHLNTTFCASSYEPFESMATNNYYIVTVCNWQGEILRYFSKSMCFIARGSHTFS